MKNKNYYLILIFLILYGSVFPSIYPLVYKNLDYYYFTMDIVSDESYIEGYLYTISSSLILCLIIYIFKVNKNISFASYRNIGDKYYNILLFLSLIYFIIEFTLDTIYGKIASNIVSQRDQIGTSIGYLARILNPAPYIILLLNILENKKIKLNTIGILILIFIKSVLSESRSGIIDILFFIIIGYSYSATNILHINYKIIIKFFLLVVVGYIAASLGDYSRGAINWDLHNRIIERFYFNNQVLYLAIEDHNKIYEILTYNQPDIILQSISSFIFERKDYSSSFRLLEYWGGTMSIDNHGHIAGYAYGWLGLSYGLMKWYGLALITVFYSFIFYMLRFLIKKPSILNLIFFTGFSGILLESFSNMGLDSMIEKFVKTFLSLIMLSIIILTLKLKK